MFKTVCGVMCAAGIILIMGVAGSDCDGKCMENAMSLADTVLYSGLGLALLGAGAWGLSRT